MVKEELNRRSPLRALEKSIGGGVGKGNIGVIASKAGVGKTACLVHIATDKLLRDRHVIHVSFSPRTDHILTWYDDIFAEIARKRGLDHSEEVKEQLMKNRVIMNFSQAGVEISSVLASVEAMIRDGHFNADAVMFDSFNIAEASPEDLKAIRDFAQSSDLEVWATLSIEGVDPIFEEDGVPAILRPYLDHLSVVIGLHYENQVIHFHVAKAHDHKELKELALKLDPKTLLIAE